MYTQVFNEDIDLSIMTVFLHTLSNGYNWERTRPELSLPPPKYLFQAHTC